ncbi:sensor histidine kinase [Halarchaeum salinum]|uniref:histidine kinase n=1 Tax=Halarchaeum salinum TaxID=489912 RepID=A0AAV3S790_9EURY
MGAQSWTADTETFSLADYWPVVVVAAFSITLTVYQLHAFRHIPTTLPKVALDVVFAVILLGGVGIVQRLRANVPLYWPFMVGITLVHIFALVEVLDELVRQPFWFDFVFGDITAPAGALFLFLGLRRWVATQEAQRHELEEQTAELTRRAERLDEFAGVVSHDLRNPIMLAKARLDVACEHPEGAAEHLAVVEDALERMETIVDDTLTLARDGRTVTDPEPVDVATLANECWRAASVPESDANLDVDLDASKRIAADPARLRQIFENLFANSVRHAGPAVTVTVDNLDDTGFYVADDGPGIPPEKRNTVLDAGYTDADDGTGFGLAIVDEIADAHGWELDIAESEHGGARFEFRGVERAAHA